MTGTLKSELTIREFEPGDQSTFQRLNEEWIERYFVLEPKDREALSNPESTILNRGGRVFLAFRDGQGIGCCALIAFRPGEFEVAKMAVTQSAQGTGVGRKLLTRVIEEARAAGAKRLYLETNQALTPAITLYESVGFRHLPPERVIPSPYARANVYMEMNLAGTG